MSMPVSLHVSILPLSLPLLPSLSLSSTAVSTTFSAAAEGTEYTSVLPFFRRLIPGPITLATPPALTTIPGSHRHDGMQVFLFLITRNTTARKIQGRDDSGGPGAADRHGRFWREIRADLRPRG